MNRNGNNVKGEHKARVVYSALGEVVLMTSSNTYSDTNKKYAVVIIGNVILDYQSDYVRVD